VDNNSRYSAFIEPEDSLLRSQKHIIRHCQLFFSLIKSK